MFHLPHSKILPSLTRPGMDLQGIPTEDELVDAYCEARGVPRPPEQVWRFYLGLVRAEGRHASETLLAVLSGSAPGVGKFTSHLSFLNRRRAALSLKLCLCSLFNTVQHRVPAPAVPLPRLRHPRGRARAGLAG